MCQEGEGSILSILAWQLRLSRPAAAKTARPAAAAEEKRGQPGVPGLSKTQSGGRRRGKRGRPAEPGPPAD